MTTEQPFKCELLQVWVKEPARGGMLKNASLQQLGDRTFVVGTIVARASGELRDGLTMWFPIEDVVMLTEYPDRARADAVYAARKPVKKGRRWW